MRRIDREVLAYLSTKSEPVPVMSIYNTIIYPRAKFGLIPEVVGRNKVAGVTLIIRSIRRLKARGLIRNTGTEDRGRWELSHRNPGGWEVWQKWPRHLWARRTNGFNGWPVPPIFRHWQHVGVFSTRAAAVAFIEQTMGTLNAEIRLRGGVSV